MWQTKSFNFTALHRYDLVVLAVNTDGVYYAHEKFIFSKWSQQFTEDMESWNPCIGKTFAFGHQILLSVQWTQVQNHRRSLNRNDMGNEV